MVLSNVELFMWPMEVLELLMRRYDANNSFKDKVKNSKDPSSFLKNRGYLKELLNEIKGKTKSSLDEELRFTIQEGALVFIANMKEILGTK